MSWFTLSGAVVLNGVLLASASGAIGLNYRKNRFFNTGLTGIVYLGTLISDILGRLMQVNPYWSIPISLILGAILNLALNVLYIDMMNKTGDRKTVNAISIVACLIFYLVGRIIYSMFRGEHNLIMIPTLKYYDFILFGTPGIVIVSVALLVMNVLLQFILSPVVEDRGLTKFDKWDFLTYGLSGATACLAGAFYRFWFMTGNVVLLLVLSSVFVGGVDKKLNPFLGGFLTSALWMGLTDAGQHLIGEWAGYYSFIIPIILSLIGIFFFPKGVIGKTRSILEYNY